MKTLVSALALSLALVAGPVTAQSARDPAAEARIHADVAFLADDALEGRGTGQRGYDLAAQYVQTRMQGMGLQPGANGSWRQPIVFARTRVADQGATLTWTPAGGAPVVWTNGQHLVINAGRVDGHAANTAQLVFVGYGLDAADQGFDDYAGLDVTGKIVVVLSGAPKGLDSEVAAHLSGTKNRVAAAHGAVGVITLNTTVSAQRMTQASISRFAGRSQTTWVGADGKPYSAAPEIAHVAYLGDDASAALFASAARSYADIRAEADQPGGRPKGFALAGQATFDVHTRREDMVSSNVVGLIPGTDPALRDEVIILTAHLDHIGVLEAGDDRINNGALDNAGGTATMLEAARILAANPPRRSILVVALTAEEMGLLGSDYLARHPLVAADRVVANVNLDMPILTYDFTDVVAFGAEHSTMGPLVAAAARTEGVTLSPDPMPQQGIFTRSDHYSFVRQGVPSVMLATGFANGGEAAWGTFLGGQYHSPSDDLTQTMDWTAAARFARVNAAIARAIGNADQQPLWYAGNTFGDQFAPGSEKAPRPE